MKIFLENKNIFKCFVVFWKLSWKIFLGIWLHSENVIFLLVFHIFSANLSAFKKNYKRKFQYIILKKQKSKQNHSLNSKILSKWEREEERVRDWGKERDRSRKR